MFRAIVSEPLNLGDPLSLRYAEVWRGAINFRTD
jgi:hypothetical protein